MALRGHLGGRDFLLDTLHEGHQRDVGDGIVRAGEPAGGSQLCFHLVEHRHQLRPRGAALFLRVRLARSTDPRLLAFLARDLLQPLGQLLVRPLRRRLRQAVYPVEDDQVANALVGMADPVAHACALAGVRRPQWRLGKALIQVLADRAALVERLAVVDQGRDDTIGIDLQVLG